MREQLFDQPITKVEKKDDGTLELHIGHCNAKSISEHHALQAFPLNLPIWCPEDRQALLSWNAGKMVLIDTQWIVWHSFLDQSRSFSFCCKNILICSTQ
jgi:hypothetical protein